MAFSEHLAKPRGRGAPAKCRRPSLFYYKNASDKIINDDFLQLLFLTTNPARRILTTPAYPCHQKRAPQFAYRLFDDEASRLFTKARQKFFSNETLRSATKKRAPRKARRAEVFDFFRRRKMRQGDSFPLEQGKADFAKVRFQRSI